jgi:hypothetical protein
MHLAKKSSLFVSGFGGIAAHRKACNTVRKFQRIVKKGPNGNKTVTLLSTINGG